MQFRNWFIASRHPEPDASAFRLIGRSAYQPEGASPRFGVSNRVEYKSKVQSQSEPDASAFRLMGGGNFMAFNSDEPIAFFITWTVYGTHLQGDLRGWRKWKLGEQPPKSKMAEWHAGRLSHPVILLSLPQRDVVEAECRRHSEHRGWRLWEVNARTNHVHVVVTARGFAGDVVRDQFKANCTRGLREQHAEFRGRPVWTVGGDWQCVNSEEELEAVCEYVREAQDRMEFKNNPSAGGR